MNKNEVIDFFNRMAPSWDDDMIRNEPVISEIMEHAGITRGVRVLDVACGTGVLFPDYLARNVERVTGVDISPRMIQIASCKFSDPRITLVNADIQAAPIPGVFNRCMLYNALPHFQDPGHLIACLAKKLEPGGRLTVAHGASREAINKCHAGAADHVSIGLISSGELAKLFSPLFNVDTVISDDEKYIVSGTKK